MRFGRSVFIMRYGCGSTSRDFCRKFLEDRERCLVCLEWLLPVYARVGYLG